MHVVVDEHSTGAMDAAAMELDKILMADIRD